jgi:hypothetical protein
MQPRRTPTAGLPDLVVLEPKRCPQPLVPPVFAGPWPGAEPPAVLAAHRYRGATRQADTPGAADLRAPVPPVAAAGPGSCISSTPARRARNHGEPQGKGAHGSRPVGLPARSIARPVPAASRQAARRAADAPPALARSATAWHRAPGGFDKPERNGQACGPRAGALVTLMPCRTGPARWHGRNCVRPGLMSIWGRPRSW